MNLLPMNKLGASETSPGVLTFGIFLPGIGPTTVAVVNACVIAEVDEIRGGIAPTTFALTHSLDSTYGDFWSGTWTLPTPSAPTGHSAEVTTLRCLYWFQLVLPASGSPPTSPVIDRLIDPLAREFGFKDLSAVTIGEAARPWAASEAAWRTPALSDLIIYEIELNELGGSLVRSKAMLPYLQQLGVTAVEVMPVTNVAQIIDWGYSPLAYFGVDARFGRAPDFQAFVEAAHACGLAVLVDMVYGHTDERFLYKRVYAEANLPNPVMGPDGPYGPQPIYTSPLIRDFFYTVNQYWLQTFHVDGFRYDNVNVQATGYWDNAGGGYYSALAKATYELVAAAVAAGPSADWQRFSSPDALRLVQCAECLDTPEVVLNTTYSNLTWQDKTLGAAAAAATGQSLYPLGMQSGLYGFPISQTLDGITLSKSAIQYVENHDHMRFVCNYGTHPIDDLQSPLLFMGNRTDDPGGSYTGRWFAVQPYLILVLLGIGVPLLWEGQEIGENYYVPTDGNELGRIRIFRPVRWGDYANDGPGSALARLVKKLIQMRKGSAQFRTGDHAFINDYANYQSKGLLVFTRTQGATVSLVALNFTNNVQNAAFTFAQSGTYTEQIDGAPALVATAGSPCAFSVPGNYGRVWTGP